MRLTGIKALITGGNSGIGRAIALTFAEAGADLVISYHRNESSAKETVKAVQAMGRRATAIQANFAFSDHINRLAEQALESLGQVDVLVNNAAILIKNPDFLTIALEDFDRTIQINLKAPLILTQKMVGHMINQSIKGSVINISSLSAEIVTSGLTSYECSKSALHMLTKSSASALAKYGIRVNAIAPGLIETNMNLSQREKDPKAWQKRAGSIPLNRVGQPADIASIALMLASNKSHWMTGSIITIDGGLSVRNPF